MVGLGLLALLAGCGRGEAALRGLTGSRVGARGPLDAAEGADAPPTPKDDRDPDARPVEDTAGVGDTAVLYRHDRHIECLRLDRLDRRRLGL